MRPVYPQCVFELYATMATEHIERRRVRKQGLSELALFQKRLLKHCQLLCRFAGRVDYQSEDFRLAMAELERVVAEGLCERFAIAAKDHDNLMAFACDGFVDLLVEMLYGGKKRSDVLARVTDAGRRWVA
ncbi:MAG: hypothetical protein U0136_22000 [Bdellovibrionota bacterium]